MAQDCQTVRHRGKQECLTKSCGYYSADPRTGRTLGGTRMYTAILTRTCSPIRKERLEALLFAAASSSISNNEQRSACF
jgi:hypothetical protein